MHIVDALLSPAQADDSPAAGPVAPAAGAVGLVGGAVTLCLCLLAGLLLRKRRPRP